MHLSWGDNNFIKKKQATGNKIYLNEQKMYRQSMRKKKEITDKLKEVQVKEVMKNRLSNLKYR